MNIPIIVALLLFVVIHFDFVIFVSTIIVFGTFITLVGIPDFLWKRAKPEGVPVISEGLIHKDARMATAASRHVVAVVRHRKIHYVKVGSWRGRALDSGCVWKPGPPTSVARFRNGQKGVCTFVCLPLH